MCVYIYVYLSIYLCVYIYIYIYIHTHNEQLWLNKDISTYNYRASPVTNRRQHCSRERFAAVLSISCLVNKSVYISDLFV